MALAKASWPECISQHMKVDVCKDFIDNEIATLFDVTDQYIKTFIKRKRKDIDPWYMPWKLLWMIVIWSLDGMVMVWYTIHCKFLYLHTLVFEKYGSAHSSLHNNTNHIHILFVFI